MAQILVVAILLQSFVSFGFVQGATTSELTITINGNSISLNWNDYLTNEKGYIVEKKVDSGSFYAFSYPPTNATTSWDYLEAGKTYTYRVKVKDSTDNTYLYTDEVTVRLNDLERPNSLEVTPVSHNQIDLKWTFPNQVSNNTIIERRAENDTTWYPIARVGIGQNTYSDTSIVSGVKYYYKIRAYSTENIRTIAYPDESTGSGAYSLLYKPTNLYGYALSNYRIQLKWQDNSIETAFVIERKSPEEGVFKEIAVVPQNTIAYIDEDDEESPVDPDMLYTYRIKAVTGNASSEYSETASISSTYLRAPQDLSSSYESGENVKLAWQDLTIGETGFEIWRREVSAAGTSTAWELHELMGRNANSFTDLSVLPGTNYYYKVRAKINDNSVYSDFSNETAIWTSVIAAPSNLEYKIIGQSEVELTWKDSGNVEAGFSVERKIGFWGQWYRIANLEPNTTKYNDKWLSSSDINYYRIKAYDRSNAVNYSNEVVVAMQIPEAPSNLQAHALSSNEVQLTWQDNSLIENEFVIEAKQLNRFKEIARVNSNTTTFIHKGANDGRSIIYRVRSVNGFKESGYSNEATAITKQSVSYTDLNGVKWAIEAIENLASRDAFEAKDGSKFYPQQTITRGEFCSILIKSLELDGVAAGRFEDVSVRHKYYDEIITAAKLGIISKDRYDKVYPDKLITREQAGVMLALALKVKGTPLPEANSSILKQFADYRAISDSSAENIAAVCGAGILSGRYENGKNYLKLSSYVTRAEAAVMVYKAIRNS